MIARVTMEARDGPAKELCLFAGIDELPEEFCEGKGGKAGAAALKAVSDSPCSSTGNLEAIPGDVALRPLGR